MQKSYMKKAIHNFSKLLAWAFFGVALFSCSNASGGYDSSSSNRKSYPVVRFVANMQADFAAAPQEISGLVSRSAMPDIAISAGDDGFKYYVEAVTGTPGSDSYIRHFVYGTTSTMELGLESGKTWNVTCGIGEIEPDSATPSDHTKGTVLTVLMSDNDPSVTITPDEPVYVKTFGLKPSITTDGTGTINLKLKIMATTWFVKVSCSAQGWKDANGGDETIVLNEHQDNDSPILHIGSIKSGIYDVVFKFCDDKGALNYCTVQTINVFDDMTTSVWRDDGSGAVQTESGQTVFNVTESVINLFTQTTMYVGDTGLGGLAPNDQNSGTAFEPLATLHEAAYRIKKYGQGADYTIFVSGTVQGCATFDSDITRDQAKTITIMGYNDSGDKLKGYASKLGNIVDFNGVTINTFFPESKEFNPVITVKTAVPITIQNVDICEGASNGGSGLCIDGAGCSVTIKDGVTISGNKTGKNGGGVSVRAGKFYMKGGKITGNSAFNSSSGNLVGGGVCLRSGAYFEMTGGEISLNRACYGGGVGLVNLAGDSGSNKFLLKRGKICQNIADGFVSGGSKCGYGGGIMITSGDETVHHQVTMTGGEISGNKVNFDSSAVEVSSGAIFEMTGGVIKDNGLVVGEEGSSNYSDISVSYSANYFCLGGSAYIPAGTDKNHCVYLNSLKNGSNPLQMAKIDLSSNLSRHSQSDPLVIQFNTSGEHAAKRGATVASASFDLTNAKEYIVPASSDWNLKLSSDKKSLVLDAPIWVAGSGAKQCTGTPSEDGPGTKSAPYKSIYHACAAMADPSVEYTIYIDGKLTVPQETPYMATPKAASITIQGANGNNSVDVLDGGSCDNHVLSLYAQADTTIKYLKITGARITTENSGSSRARCGGGVYSATDKSVTLSSGTLIAGNRTVNGGGGVYKENGKLFIEEGAEISGYNMAANGGGVYLYGADLYMSGGKITGNSTTGSVAAGTGKGGGIYCDGDNSKASNIYLWGKALVGDASIANPPTSGTSSYSNDALYGGGIYVYRGNLWLGYKDANKPQAFEKVSGDVVDGIIGNYASYRGGGVYIDCDDYDNNLYMASGQIACNGTQTQVAYNGNGGGIYIYTDGRPIVDISGGSIKNNRSYKGGAIYFGAGAGQLKISGSADIPYGINKKNDVYLYSHDVDTSPLKLGAALKDRAAQFVIGITLDTSNFLHGDIVVQTDPGRAITDTDKKCIVLASAHVSDGLELSTTADGKSLKLDKPIYVKQGGTPSGSGTADGTKTKPYASIEDACKKGMTSDSLDYTIKVIGNDEPLQNAQKVPESGFNAKSITIMGANGLYTEGAQAGQPQDAIYGMGCVSAVLTIMKQIPVTIRDLMITGGSNDDPDVSKACNGGGVASSQNAALTLSSGTLITGNTAKSGGGVYKNKGTLVIEDGAVISGNTATGFTNSLGYQSAGGGGVALNAAILDMSGGKICGNKVESSDRFVTGGGLLCMNGSSAYIYGSAVIGGVDASNPAAPTSVEAALAAGGNVACGTATITGVYEPYQNGGAGIFVHGSTSYTLLYLGFKPDGSKEELTGGVYGNYTPQKGGGIALYGTSKAKAYIDSGNVSYNYAYSSGGGVYNAGSITMSGGEIYGNSVTGSDGTGGGVANNGFFGMSGGKIYANDGGLLGGGVYQSSGSSEIALSGTAVIGDTSKPNVAKQGGGIGCKEDVASITRIGWYSGSERSNYTGGLMGNQATAGSGGAIYINKSSKLQFFSGRISGNTASAGKGNGVYAHPEANAIEMKGYVRFDASDDIWLAPPESGNPKTIKITGALTPTDTGAIGGTAADKTATITPGAYNVGDTILTGTTDALVSGNYDKFALAQDASDPSQTWILDSDGCIYSSQPVLAIDRSNGMTSQDRNFITGAVSGSGTEDDPYVLELGALDTLKFQIKGGSGSKAVYSAESNSGMTAGVTLVKPNYSRFYNLTIPDAGLKKKMLIVINPNDPATRVEVPFWVLLKKPQYFMGTPYTADGSNVKFGDYPQTIKESSVNLSSTIYVQQQQDGVAQYTYYLGDDGSWYCLQNERGCATGSNKYSDDSTVGQGNTTSRYFKVEPIEWKLLKTSSGTRLLHAKNILEAMHFDTSSNDYAGSVIRTYLNGSFLNSAFSPSLRDIIRETTIDGVTDKLFLFRNDAVTFEEYFPNDNARIRITTDFAKATGAYQSETSGRGGYWWTQTAGSSGYALGVKPDGSVSNCNITENMDGIAPAMWVKLY